MGHTPPPGLSRRVPESPGLVVIHGGGTRESGSGVLAGPRSGQGGVGAEDALGPGDGGDPHRAPSSQPHPQPLPRGARAS